MLEGKTIDRLLVKLQNQATMIEQFIWTFIKITEGLHYKKCIYDENTDIYYFTKCVLYKI